MSARKCGRDDVTWRATHTLLVSTNVPPIVSETDHGTWRWLALLVFPYTWLKPGQVPHGEFERAGDPGLRARMRRGRARHEAVLAWIIDGALKWYAAGQVMPPLPQRVERDTAGWRRESDLVLAYMDEELTFEPAAYIRSGDLQQDFNNWLNGRHQAQWSAQTFNSRFGGHEEIARRGVHNNGGKAMKRDGKVIKGWAGVRLRDRNEHEWTRGWTRP
jgi:putative DNA primase/helicase